MEKELKLQKIKAIDLVGKLKDMRRDLMLYGNGVIDVDFLGASLPYVKEKANALIEEIQDWKRWLSQRDKEQN